MFLKTLKNNEKYHWTEHAKFKMKFYGLSPQRVLRVIRAPQRIEEGIVEKTIAVMQPASTHMKDGKKIWSQEIWAMYQIRAKNEELKMKSKDSVVVHNSKLLILNYANQQIRIISAWRYPGMSPKNNPIPREIIEELDSID